MAGHPLVGAWLLDTDTADPSNPPTLATFSSDGIYTQLEPESAPGVGAWETTGAQTEDMNFHEIFPDEQGGGMTTIRAAIEVAADWQSVTATYTLEFVDAGGTATGQYGPGQVSGTRIAVELMGEPVGTLKELFAQFEEGEAPPEASPAVSITDYAFAPDMLEIAAGTTVTWTNEDAAPHTVTADDGAFESKVLADEGGTFSFTFDEPGTYTYHCNIHLNMRATIIDTQHSVW
jgi:plastocyanin